MRSPPPTRRTSQTIHRPERTPMPTLTPHLWFDKDAEDAPDFYCSIFPGSRVLERRRYENTPSGTVTSVLFELGGQRVVALMAGPEFRFNESFSFLVSCETQEE